MVIEDYDVATVKCMLSFLYTGTYEVEDSNDAVVLGVGTMDVSNLTLSMEESGICDMPMQTVSPLVQHIRVNSIAGFYQIPELIRKANRKIQYILDGGSVKIKADVLCHGIDEAFRTCGDEEVQQIMGNFAAANIDTLIAHDDFKSIYGVGDSANAIMQSLIALGRQMESDYQTKAAALASEHATTKTSFDKYKRDAERDRSLAKKSLKDAVSNTKMLRDRVAALEKEVGNTKKIVQKDKTIDKAKTLRQKSFGPLS